MSKNKADENEFSRLRWAFTSQKKRDRLMSQTLDLLRLLPETKALLDLAAAKNIEIRFNGDFIRTLDSGVTVTNRTTDAVHIEIKPYRTPEDIAPALIHELRHVWQAEQLHLTPKTMALGEPDARTALLLTRVKEADAYAYTDLAISRINNAFAAIEEGFAHGQKLQHANGGRPLTPAQEDEVSDVIAARVASHLEADKKLAAETFIKALGWLDGYDRETLEAYHKRYTDPAYQPLKHLTEKDGHVLSVADIRKLAVAGEGPTRISYLDHLDDKAFVAAVMKDVDPQLLDVASLMTVFEKAATPAGRQQIDTRLREALQPKPPKP